MHSRILLALCATLAASTALAAPELTLEFNGNVPDAGEMNGSGQETVFIDYSVANGVLTDATLSVDAHDDARVIYFTPLPAQDWEFTCVSAPGSGQPRTCDGTRARIDASGAGVSGRFTLGVRTDRSFHLNETFTLTATLGGTDSATDTPISKSVDLLVRVVGEAKLGFIGGRLARYIGVAKNPQGELGYIVMSFDSFQQMGDVMSEGPFTYRATGLNGFTAIDWISTPVDAGFQASIVDAQPSPATFTPWEDPVEFQLAQNGRFFEQPYAIVWAPCSPLLTTSTLTSTHIEIEGPAGVMPLTRDFAGPQFAFLGILDACAEEPVVALDPDGYVNVRLPPAVPIDEAFVLLPKNGTVGPFPAQPEPQSLFLTQFDRYSCNIPGSTGPFDLATFLSTHKDAGCKLVAPENTLPGQLFGAATYNVLYKRDLGATMRLGRVVWRFLDAQIPLSDAVCAPEGGTPLEAAIETRNAPGDELERETAAVTTVPQTEQITAVFTAQATPATAKPGEVVELLLNSGFVPDIAVQSPVFHITAPEGIDLTIGSTRPDCAPTNAEQTAMPDGAGAIAYTYRWAPEGESYWLTSEACQSPAPCTPAYDPSLLVKARIDPSYPWQNGQRIVLTNGDYIADAVVDTTSPVPPSFFIEAPPEMSVRVDPTCDDDEDPGIAIVFANSGGEPLTSVVVTAAVPRAVGAEGEVELAVASVTATLGTAECSLDGTSWTTACGAGTKHVRTTIDSLGIKQSGRLDVQFVRPEDGLVIRGSASMTSAELLPIASVLGAPGIVGSCPGRLIIDGWWDDDGDQAHGDEAVLEGSVRLTRADVPGPLDIQLVDGRFDGPIASGDYTVDFVSDTADSESTFTFSPVPSQPLSVVRDQTVNLDLPADCTCDDGVSCTSDTCEHAQCTFETSFVGATSEQCFQVAGDPCAEGKLVCTQTGTTCEPLPVAELPEECRPPLQLIGSGCSAGASASWLAVVALVLLLRRRAWVVALLFVAGTARAQDSTGYQLNQFDRLPNDHDDALNVSGASVLGHLRYHFGLAFEHVVAPLTLVEVGQDEGDAVVDSETRFEVGGAVGLFQRFELGVMVPIVISSDGDGSAILGHELESAGLGDIRFVPKGTIIAPREAGFGLALAMPLYLPTGSSEQLTGEGSVRAEPRLALEYRFAFGLRVLANFGVLLRKQQDLYNLRFGNALRWSAAVVSPIYEGLSGQVSVYGSKQLVDAKDPDDLGEDTDDTRGENPVELDLALKYTLPMGLAFGAGAGFGLVEGAGAPELRIFANVSFTPKDVDSDGDGLLDSVDDCPTDPEDKDGFEDDDGCPELDNDDDGILDAADKCVLEPEDKDDHEDEDGCPELDNDGDGIVDSDDRCLNTPGVPEKAGCPWERFTVEREAIKIKEKVFFELNRAVVKPESYPLLDELADALIKTTRIRHVEVQGHTDHAGSHEYNMKLSQDRAEAVTSYLLKKGVPPNKVSAKGFGFTRPLVQPSPDGETEEQAAQNRRVEFVITDQDLKEEIIR